MYRRDGLRAERIDARQACALVPCLQESLLVGAVHDLDAMDIDVAELHQGFLRGMARAGARLRCGAELSGAEREVDGDGQGLWTLVLQDGSQDRKSTRLNSSHSQISYAVFCLKKKNNNSLRHRRSDVPHATRADGAQCPADAGVG